MHACIMYSTCTQYGLAAVVGVVGGQDGNRQRERVIRSIIAACWLDGLLHCILCCVRYLHTYGHLGRYVRIWVPCVRYLQDVVHYQQKRIIIIKKRQAVNIAMYMKEGRLGMYVCTYSNYVGSRSTAHQAIRRVQRNSLCYCLLTR